MHVSSGAATHDDVIGFAHCPRPPITRHEPAICEPYVQGRSTGARCGAHVGQSSPPIGQLHQPPHQCAWELRDASGGSVCGTQGAVASCTQPGRFVCAAGEMLHVAEPFLERNLHPTVIVRGFHRALEDAVAIVDDMAFPIDVDDRGQMLKILNSTIGTKYTARFGDLLAVTSHRRLSNTFLWASGVRKKLFAESLHVTKRRKRLGGGGGGGGGVCVCSIFPFHYAHQRQDSRKGRQDTLRISHPMRCS